MAPGPGRPAGDSQRSFLTLVEEAPGCRNDVGAMGPA